MANNQSSEQRGESMRQALVQVLSRLLQSNVMNGKKLKTILDQPDRYISQYRYLYQTGEVNLTQRLLRVEFNQVAIKQALKTKGLVGWGEGRPSVLVWLLKLDQKQWFKPDIRLLQHRVLTAAAKKKGIPLVLPLMDLTDRQQLSYQGTDLNNQVMRASGRYQTDAILLGRLSASTGNSGDIQWTLFHAGEIQQWRVQHASLTAMMDSGISGAYERLVLRKTPVPALAPASRVIPASEPGGVILRISGITDLNEFARVTDYLKSVKQLDSSQWLQVTPDELWFQLQPQGGVTRLRQRFDSSGVFQAVYGENSEGVMHYRLLSLLEPQTSTTGND